MQNLLVAGLGLGKRSEVKPVGMNLGDRGELLFIQAKLVKLSLIHI